MILFELFRLCCVSVSFSCTMSSLAESGPDFFEQLSLPDEVSFPASWASVTPRDAGLAKQGLDLQMGGSTPDLLFTSGMENPTSTPALCKSLAMLDGMFLSPANRMVRMGHEEVGVFLAACA